MADVLVIGGGHAGVEAACAAARRGARTVLLTFDRRGIGAMSCNPAVGGIGKGHLVREVDAFDGVMGRAADAAAVHYRMLNRSKGAAVRGPRVQADRRRYAAAVQAAIAAEPLLRVVEGEAVSLSIRGGAVVGVGLANGSALAARAVVLATGTFLSGRLFRGEERGEGGRIDERAATALGEQLRGMGLAIGRLKTGTPPRLDGRTIDWARLGAQASDREPWTMSPMTSGSRLPQVACAVTRTNEATHAIIRRAGERSPLLTGAIEGAGPRYCPSIEDKVRRFGDRDGHQLFLEPEGLDDPTVYPNGLSTSLPVADQAAVVASIAGLERAVITAPGYAVEYDYLDPRGLDARLAHKGIAGLFCTGQINGTTGYEEAAGQGLIAGLNAAAHACGLAAVTLDRADSYLGVMIDDLILQGVSEPYRMLTARAEFRLRLRADNAETRLGPLARSLGCVSAARRRHQEARESARSAAAALLERPIAGGVLRERGATAPDETRRGREWLLQHDWPVVAPELDANVADEVTEDCRYAPYLQRQETEVARLRADERVVLPAGLDFERVPGLSSEMIERLSAAEPATLGAAGRVRGVTPAALSALLLHVHRSAA